MPTVWTIGHSTRTFAEFAELLVLHRVEAIADVRAFPGSRRHPHFNRETLNEALETIGIAYSHMPALGGRRRPRADAPPSGWRVAAFHAYAGYMTSPEFAEALDELVAMAGERRCAVMCAEAVPWRCHRTLISDALVARGFTVRHIVSAAAPAEHALTSFGSVRGGVVSYSPDEAGKAERGPGATAAERERRIEQEDLFPGETP